MKVAQSAARDPSLCPIPAQRMLSLVLQGRQHEIFELQLPEPCTDLPPRERLIFRKRRTKSCKDRCERDVEFYEFIVKRYFSWRFRVEMQVFGVMEFGFAGLLMQDLREIGRSCMESITFEFKPKLCERYLGRACRFCVLNRIRYSDSYSYCPYKYFLGKCRESLSDGELESSINCECIAHSDELNFSQSSTHSSNLTQSSTQSSNLAQSVPKSTTQSSNHNLTHCSLEGLLRSKFLKVLAGDLHTFFPSLTLALQALECALEPFRKHAKHILQQFPLLDWDHIEDWLQATATPTLQLYKELVSIRDVSVMITFVRPGSPIGTVSLDAEFVLLEGIGLWARVKLIDLDDKLNGSKVIEHAGQTREILEFLRENSEFECYSE